jgi:hypothetical protein
MFSVALLYRPCYHKGGKDYCRENSENLHIAGVCFALTGFIYLERSDSEIIGKMVEICS